MAASKTVAKATKKDSTSKAAPSAISQVKSLIENAGSKGISALELGTGIGYVSNDMEANDRAAALKRVRVLARKAIGGKAPEYDGRTAVYKLS